MSEDQKCEALNQGLYIGFINSGVGAVPGTVQSTLRRMAFSGQYNSAERFEASRDALTDSLGVKTVSTQAGSVTAPSINLSDTGTGFYRPESNQIGVSLGGSQICFFASNGLNIRGLSNELNIDGKEIPGSGCIRTAVAGDGSSRWLLEASGAMSWGSGSAATDIALSRLGPKALLVDGNGSGACQIQIQTDDFAGVSPYIRIGDFYTYFGLYRGAALAVMADAGNLTLQATQGTVAIVSSTGINATGALTVSGGFGCNNKSAQAAVASGGALNAYGAGNNGLDSGANMSAMHALVVAMRAALVANGIMS